MAERIKHSSLIKALLAIFISSWAAATFVIYIHGGLTLVIAKPVNSLLSGLILYFLAGFFPAILLIVARFRERVFYATTMIWILSVGALAYVAAVSPI